MFIHVVLGYGAAASSDQPVVPHAEFPNVEWRHCRSKRGFRLSPTFPFARGPHPPGLPVVGSMIVPISVILFAGNPLSFAC
jgi:hypothetical protein